MRGFAIPHCPPLHLHVQQPQPLINLRSFSARGGLTSVLVRAQSATFAERSKPAVSSFEQLGLGEELLSFLSEQKLTTPTEIQVGAFYGACLMHYFEALASAGFHVLVVKVQEEESTAVQLLPASQSSISSLYLFLKVPSLLFMYATQAQAVSEVLRGGDVLLASHTGSGKTLAYLLPLVRRIYSDGKPQYFS